MAGLERNKKGRIFGILPDYAEVFLIVMFTLFVFRNNNFGFTTEVNPISLNSDISAENGTTTTPKGVEEFKFSSTEEEEKGNLSWGWFLVIALAAALLSFFPPNCLRIFGRFNWLFLSERKKQGREIKWKKRRMEK